MIDRATPTRILAAVRVAALLAGVLVACAPVTNGVIERTTAPGVGTAGTPTPTTSPQLTFAIRGRVTAQTTGASVEGVDVVAHLRDGSHFASATSDAAGTYALFVPAGTYYLRFRPRPGSRLAELWWKDSALQREAHPVRVIASDVQSIDISLPPVTVAAAQTQPLPSPPAAQTPVTTPDAPTVVPPPSPASRPPPAPPPLPGPGPLPSPGITYRVGTGVGEADTRQIRSGFDIASRYLREELGGDPPRPIIVEIVSETSRFCCSVTKDGNLYFNVAHEQWQRRGMTERDRALDQQKTAAHEYIHTWQSHIGCPAARTTMWLSEGVAEYVAWQAMVGAGLISASDARTGQVRNPATFDVRMRGILQTCERGSSICGEAYSLFYLAVDRLSDRSGVRALRGLCDAVASGLPWSTAFATVFGMSVETFYAEFEAYRDTLR